MSFAADSNRLMNTLFLRRWFVIRNGQLLYMKRNNDHPQQQAPQSVMVPDLRLCTIRPASDNDRRFVFEILSPNRFIGVLFSDSNEECLTFFSSHLLQADSQLQCDQWVSSLQLAISHSFKTPNGGLPNSASVRNFASPELRKRKGIFVLAITEVDL